MVLLTIAGNLVALSGRMHLKCCLTTGMKLKLCKCKQLSLELTLTLGLPLVIKPILPLQAEVVAEAVVEAVVVLQVGVVVEVSDLSAKRWKRSPSHSLLEHRGFRNPVCAHTFAALKGGMF